MAKKKKGKHFLWKCFIAIILLTLFILWWGVPTYNKWRADRLVDKLCAKDGGTKIYEKIKLSASEYNKYWITNLQSEKHSNSKSDYYFKSKIIVIKGSPQSSNINKLAIWKTVTKIIRTKDKKIMSELISYTRSGGDPLGPWHPSHYTCPKNGFSRDIFVKQ